MAEVSDRAPTGRLWAALVALLASVYLLTYSGTIESGDSFQLYDAVGSLVTFGDLRLDVASGMRQPQTFTPVEFYPFSTVDAEPLQILLAAPLYWLAHHIPGIGLGHTGWLFNVMIGALAGGCLFLYGRTLGYSQRASLAAALAFGGGTIIWAYSKTFFREPLALLMIVLAAWQAERWRASGYRRPGALVALLLAIVGVILAKATAILALPALVVIAAPSIQAANRRRILIAIASLTLLAGVVFALLALFGEQIGLGARYNPLARFIERSYEFFPVALHTYLLSPGGSLWGTSPVLLLALPGLWLLARRGQYRYVIAVPLLVGAFAFGYAYSSGAFWFGGMSWPPRFLVPVVPLVMVATLPVFERLFAPQRSRWLVAALSLLLVYSVWVQLSAVSLWWGEYPRALPPEADGLIEWGGGLNDIRYLRWVVLPRLWGDVPLDFAWTRTNQPLWAVGFGGLALTSLVVLLRGGRPRWLALSLLPLVVAMTGIGLRLIYLDPYYTASTDGLFPMLDHIERETGPGDVVLLSSREYERFFFNYGKFDATSARIVTQPMQPGDRPSPDQPAARTSNNPDQLLTNLTLLMIHQLTAARETLWLLENRGPDLPWAVRPIERFMAQHYYPLQIITTDATVRLIEYSTVDAPDPYSFRSPDYPGNMIFGDRLELVGYDLPLGTAYTPGQVVPLSLQWRALEPLEADYRVAWFVRAPDGTPIAQGQDSRPGGDFARTSTWEPGVPHWDNRALRLPADTPPGEYRIWLKVYRLDERFNPVDLAVRAAQQVDDTIGIIPIWLEVVPPR